ncbi:uncharacterized protein [Rutidosis leptorrhynchoides]|uniref:uncharacterized protein n=1 Tax=Rutidosis leptorrhynchoides TaxID=125765 RepID=UPI003A98EBD5
MVVGMMKWRPWPPILSKKFEAKITIKHLQGLIHVAKLGIEVNWKGSNKSNNPLNFKRKSVRRNVTKEGSLKDNGMLEWNEEFVTVCNLIGLKNGGFHLWEVAFMVFDINNLNHKDLLKKSSLNFFGLKPLCFHLYAFYFFFSFFFFIQGSSQGPKKIYPALATGSLNIAQYASSVEQNDVDISIPLSVTSGITESRPILCVSLSLQELRSVNESTEQAQRSITSLPLAPGNGEDESSGLKTGLQKVKMFRAISVNRAKKACREEEGSGGKCSVRRYDADYPFDTDSLDADEVESEEVKDDDDSSVRKSFSYGTLAYANHAGGLSYFSSTSSSEDEDWLYYRNHKETTDYYSSPSIVDQVEIQILKKSIFPWRKRKLSFRSPKNKGEPLLKKDSAEEGGDDIDFDRRMLSSSDECKSEEGTSTNGSTVSEFGDDSFEVGKWENKEVKSRDGHMKLLTQVFFASIDQRSEQAAGESACTALVAVIADWFQNNGTELPIKSQLDSLIRDGSLEWRNLCTNEVYRDRFPDKHFDLETVIQAKILNLDVVPEKSFVGFFQPEGLEEGDLRFLDGAMSFDSIWEEISKIGSNYSDVMNPLVYIVSWNDHFFVLKVDHDAYYIVDTLGERLYEGCDRAYVLKFDKDTSIERVAVDTRRSNDSLEGEKVSESQSKETWTAIVNDINEEDEVETIVCKGKESCREYIKSFLAAIPIRELKDDLKKGLMGASTPLVHHRLQIEFHHTKCFQDKQPEKIISLRR